MEQGTARPSGSVGAEEAWQRDWGQLLRLARQVAGLSLSELSGRCGLSKGYLSKLESGHASGRNPSRATLAALARALPSFGPLAHTFEPDAPRGALALVPAAAPAPTGVEDDDATLAPVRLGWRELELLVALLSLERAALPIPLTAPVLARAVGRAVAAVAPTIESLRRADVLLPIPPRSPGGAPSYRLAPDASALIGLGRVGDALVLAGALLAQAAGPQSRLT